MKANEWKRMPIIVAVAIPLGSVAGLLGVLLSGALELNLVAAKFTSIIMVCGAWGWYSNRLFDRLKLFL